jgi:hypothetical protein
VRVAFVVTDTHDGGCIVALGPPGELLESAATAFQGGRLITSWREAERRLAELLPGSPEWDALATEIEDFRSRYQELLVRR